MARTRLIHVPGAPATVQYQSRPVVSATSDPTAHVPVVGAFVSTGSSMIVGPASERALTPGLTPAVGASDRPYTPPPLAAAFDDAMRPTTPYPEAAPCTEV